MTSLIAFALLTSTAHAATPAADTILCESNDAKYSITVVKAVKPLLSVNLDKNISATAVAKTDSRYTKDVLDYFEAESKTSGKVSLRVTDVTGEAGHAAMFEDSSGKHLVNCHYDPKTAEPKKKKM